jgi:hypothetical protein
VSIEAHRHTAGPTAQSFTVDDDALAPAGESDDGLRQGHIGESREAEAQAPARGDGLAMEHEVQPVSAYGGEQIGEAVARRAKVDGPLEGVS